MGFGRGRSGERGEGQGGQESVRGQGRGLGRGQGVGGPRQGLGRMGRAPTKCVCPQCGYEAPKKRGLPCRSMKCPKCKMPLVGE
ncbi:MAG: hypothetical protein OCU12_03205 [Methanophagales archaeon]|nr:hypothetical protein [Methanophagales archaeon]